MKRNLSSQAIKAMAIGMAVTLGSSTAIGGVNVYANETVEAETLVAAEEVTTDVQPMSVVEEKAAQQLTSVSDVNNAISTQDNVVIDLDNVSDISTQTIKIVNGKSVTLTSGTNKELQDAHIKLEGNATLTIDGLKIKSTQADKGFIEATDKNNNLILKGDNTFTGDGSNSKEAIKVDYKHDSKNYLTVKGDGNLTIENYKVGIGSVTDLSENDVKNDAKSADNLVIDTTGTITMRGISHVGIGTRLGYNIQSSSYSNGLIKNGTINITTTKTGLGVSIHQMTGGDVTIESRYEIVDDGSKKRVLRAGFAADTMSGGKLTIDNKGKGSLVDVGSVNYVATMANAHIVNVLGGEINSKVENEFTTGLVTSSIRKGDITIEGTNNKNYQEGIKLYNYDEVWQGAKTENPGINPINVNDIKLSIKNIDKANEIIYTHARGSEHSYKIEYPDIKEVINENFAILNFAQGVDGYTNLTVNGTETGINLVAGTNYYVFNLGTGANDVKATVSKDGKKYDVLNASDNKVLGSFATDVDKLVLENLKVKETPVDAPIVITNGEHKYTFEITSDTKELKTVALVDYEKVAQGRTVPSNTFVDGKATIEGEVYTLTKIGNGKSLSNITDSALEGHTKEVKEVSANAFANTSITSANFPKAEKIGVNAFANTNITSATLGTETTGKIEVDSTAFSGVNTLKTVNTNKESKDSVKTAVENSASKEVSLDAGGDKETVKPNNNNNNNNSNNGSGSDSSSSGSGVVIGTNNNDTTTETTTSGNTSSVVENEDKELSFDVISLPSVEGEAKVFGDVSADYWAKPHIDKLSTAGVINGSNGMFNPNGQTKRADVTIMLVNLLGLSPESNNKFVDVNPNAYYAPYVGTASTYGIVNGSNGMFNPESVISRQDTMVMIAQILKGLDLNVNTDATALNQFNDANKVSSYATESVAILVNSGIISGNNGKLNPTAPVTRAEMATIMSKLYDVLASANK